MKAESGAGYGNKVDVFSAGVTLYMMLCGYEPFYGDSDRELIEANERAEITFPKEDWKNSKLIVRLILLSHSGPFLSVDVAVFSW